MPMAGVAFVSRLHTIGKFVCLSAMKRLDHSILGSAGSLT
jgi:hypothetical protein